MPSGLFRNLVPGESQPVAAFPWGSIQWLDSAAITGSQTLTFGVVEFAPGEGNPIHHHPNCDEVLFVLEGEIRHLLGTDELPMGPGDLIHIPKGTRHRALNVGQQRARVVVCFDTGHREVVNEE